MNKIKLNPRPGTRPSIILLGLLAVCVSGAVFAQESVLTDAEVRQELEAELEMLLLKIMDHPQLQNASGRGVFMEVDLPAREVTELGLVFDAAYEERADQQGLLVLGVTPGGSADAMGVDAGDRIVAVNGQSLLALGGDESGRLLAANQLEEATISLGEGEPVSLTVKRAGEELALSGALSKRVLPSAHLRVGDAQELAMIDEEPGCGTISIFSNPPRGQQIYPVTIAEIDGESQSTGLRKMFYVEPGLHEFKVHERIDRPGFSPRSRDRRKSQTIMIEVEPDTIYHLGARLAVENRFIPGREGYWQPMVWKQEVSRCKGQPRG